MILGINGIIASSMINGTPVDPDAAAFFARVTAAGGTLSATEQTAVNTLVVQMKADGTWSPMKAIYPMVGASAAACAQNLKSSSFTGTFNGGWTFSSNGVQGNGTNTYFNTALNVQSNLSTTSAHFSFYSRTNSNESNYDMCASGDYAVIIYSNSFYVNLTSAGIYTATVGVANTLGFYIGARTNNTNVNGYKNGTKIINNATLVSNLVNDNVYLGARGTASLFTNRQYAFSSIGDGLTDTQASNFYTAVQAFQTTLSRQV
jgi:hypothetical protein